MQVFKPSASFATSLCNVLFLSIAIVVSCQSECRALADDYYLKGRGLMPTSSLVKLLGENAPGNEAMNALMIVAKESAKDHIESTQRSLDAFKKEEPSADDVILLTDLLTTLREQRQLLTAYTKKVLDNFVLTSSFPDAFGDPLLVFISSCDTQELVTLSPYAPSLLSNKKTRTFGVRLISGLITHRLLNGRVERVPQQEIFDVLLQEPSKGPRSPGSFGEGIVVQSGSDQGNKLISEKLQSITSKLSMEDVSIEMPIALCWMQFNPSEENLKYIFPIACISQKFTHPKLRDAFFNNMRNLVQKLKKDGLSDKCDYAMQSVEKSAKSGDADWKKRTRALKASSR